MGLNFQFATASQIIFGRNSAEKIPGLLNSLGKSVMLVTGKSSDRALPLLQPLSDKSHVTVFEIPSEPTTGLINQGIELARKINCDVVIGIGGGSAIDSAKAIAALVPNNGNLLDFLEVIGKGKQLEQRPLPCIAVPTTSGTGAEATKNSVIKSEEHQVKVSLRSDLMYPSLASVDPVLAVTMPPEITASTGVDALTHLLETFVSNQSNAFVDQFCRDGMHRVARSLLKANKNGNDIAAREDMAMAGLLGGIALANVKLGAVHGFAGPMGGVLPAPHGAVCACLLPAVMEVNIEALSESNEVKMLQKYDEVAKIITGKNSAVAKDGVDWVRNLIHDLQIPKLSKYGLGTAGFNDLVQKAKKASSMKGNAVLLNDNQLHLILEQSI